MKNETLEAKLRNQLSPIYGLADMVLLIDEKPEMKQLIINQAKQVVKNKKVIDLLLVEIEAKTLNNPVVVGTVCLKCRSTEDIRRKRVVYDRCECTDPREKTLAIKCTGCGNLTECD